MSENKESLNIIDEFNVSLRELFENKDFEGLLRHVREFKEENYYIFFLIDYSIMIVNSQMFSYL